MAFKDRLKEARLNREMTQEQVAKAIGVAKSTFTGYEKGNSEPNMFTISKIMNILNIDANYLWQDEMNELGGNPMHLQYDEMEHIQKYRKLDDIGRQHVDTVLSWEIERIFYQTIHIENEEREDEVPVYIMNYYQRLASAGSGEYLFDNIPTDTIEVPANSLSEQADFVIGVNGHSMEPTYKDGDKVYVEISEEIPTGSIGIFTKGSDCFIKELGQDRLISHNGDKKRYPDILASEDIRCVGLVLGKVEED